jgi:hypothetical protein
MIVDFETRDDVSGRYLCCQLSIVSGIVTVLYDAKPIATGRLIGYQIQWDDNQPAGDFRQDVQSIVSSFSSDMRSNNRRRMIIARQRAIDNIPPIIL